MILYQEKTINFGRKEVLLLEAPNDGGYIYVSRETYDQALLLNDRFEGNIDILRQHLKLGGAHLQEIKYFASVAPEPISILAPFLGFVTVDIDMKKELRELCGILNQLSMTINFNNFTKVPAEVRADIKFNKSAVMDYERVWEDMLVKYDTGEFSLDKVDIEVVKQLIKEITESISINIPQPEPVQIVREVVVAPQTESVQSVMTTQNVQVVATPNEEGVVEEEDEDPWAFLSNTIDELDKAAAEKKEETVEVAEPVVSRSEIVDKDEELSEIDKIVALMNSGGF